MPRDGSNVYSKPPGTTAVSSATISSNAYNTFCDDVVNDLNAPRPVSAGGTGVTSLSALAAALDTARTIPANTLRGNPTGSAAAETAVDMPQLRAMLAITTAGRDLIEAADVTSQKWVLGFPRVLSGSGEWLTLGANAGSPLVLPPGGQWAYFFVVVNSATGGILGGGASVAAGGTTLNFGSATTAFTGFCWRQ